MKNLLFFICILLFTSCTTEKKLEPVTVLLEWYPNAIHSFIYVAKEKGFFKEEGLDVEILLPSGSNDSIIFTAAGKVDIGFYYMNQLILQKTEQNIPVSSIGAVSQESLSVFIAPKDKKIMSPKDFENKKIGYSGEPLSEMKIRKLVKDNGGDEKTVQLVDVGFDLITAMVTGKVDVTHGGYRHHEVPVLESKGIEVNYFSAAQYGEPGEYETILISGDETIKNKPETLKKFLRAAKKGFNYVKKHPKEAIDITFSNQSLENFPLDKNVEIKSLDTLIPLMESENQEFLSQEKELYKQRIEWLYKEKMIKKKFDADFYFKNLI